VWMGKHDDIREVSGGNSSIRSNILSMLTSSVSKFKSLPLSV
jgi:hypothetical protein